MEREEEIDNEKKSFLRCSLHESKTTPIYSASQAFLSNK